MFKKRSAAMAGGVVFGIVLITWLLYWGLACLVTAPLAVWLVIAVIRDIAVRMRRGDRSTVNKFKKDDDTECVSPTM
jgi:hypothetical protein